MARLARWLLAGAAGAWAAYALLMHLGRDPATAPYFVSIFHLPLIIFGVLLAGTVVGAIVFTVLRGFGSAAEPAPPALRRQGVAEFFAQPSAPGDTAVELAGRLRVASADDAWLEATDAVGKSGNAIPRIRVTDSRFIKTLLAGPPARTGADYPIDHFAWVRGKAGRLNGETVLAHVIESTVSDNGREYEISRT